MKPVCVVFCLAAVLLSGPAMGAEPSGQKERVFKAGAAMSNITPPLGQPIVGGWTSPPAEHVHDELHARCLVLDDGATRIGIVLCDNVGIPREVYDSARQQIEEATGLSGDRLLMAATHTHSATTARSDKKLVPAEKLSDYQQFLARRIADGVRRAINNLEPARIGWGSAEEPSEVFNRRWFVTSSSELSNPFGGTDQVRMNPPRASASLVRPAGPTDPEVAFLSVQSKDGRPIALLANYSLHYVGGVRGKEISADYFALFADRIQQLLGADRQDPPFVGIMSNGTSGDVNNIDFRNAPTKRYQPYEKMREVADKVADAVYKAHQDVKFHDSVPLAAARQELVLGVRKPTEERLAEARKILAAPEDARGGHIRERIYAQRAIWQHESPDEVSVPLQALKIGELGIAAIPFEVFTEIGRDIKDKSPFEQTFTISLANGSYGYLPTPRQHELGGYETWLGTNLVEKQASDKIEEVVLKLLGQLHGEPAAK